MEVTLGIESLVCREGGSNKAYQIVKIYVNRELKSFLRVYGPIEAPKQFTISPPNFNPEEVKSQAEKLLISKLKKYNRHTPAHEYDWTGIEVDWEVNGAVFIRRALREHGSWTREFSIGIEAQINDLAIKLQRIAQESPSITPDPHPDELLRAHVERETRAQEAQKLENWGAF